MCPHGVRDEGDPLSHPSHGCGVRIQTCVLKCLAFEQTFAAVEFKNPRRCFADLRQRNNGYPIAAKGKMIHPGVFERMEESDKRAGSRRKGADIAAFVQIAEQAGISEVICMRRPTVLFADDMINLAAEEGVILMDQEVFA